MSDFRVGQKVVCVEPRDDDEGPNPVFGSIYTISWVSGENCEELVDLVEMPNPENEYYYRGYRSSIFRPAFDRAQNTRMFFRMFNVPTEITNK